MTTLMTKIKTAATNVVLFTVAIALMGLGFVFMGTMALFALLAFGVALVAAPFVVRDTMAEAENAG